MNLSKLQNDKKLELCRMYFRAGFAFLPFIWLVNAIWFFREAFKKSPYDEQKDIKKYVLLSALGATIWLGLLIAWVVVYQTHRAEWGELGDRLSIVIPGGIP